MIVDKLRERVLGKKITEKELEYINPQFIESVSPLGRKPSMRVLCGV